jgi:hypothetical protein
LHCNKIIKQKREVEKGEREGRRERETYSERLPEGQFLKKSERILWGLYIVKKIK